MWLNAAWPRLHDLEEAGPLSPQEQQKLIGGLTCNVLYLFNTPNMVPFNRLDAVAAITQVYPRARQALIARGRKPEIIDALPTIQVVALYVLQDFRQLQDDIFKWQGLPYWQALPGARRTDQERAELKNKLGAVSAVLELLPGSIQGVLLAEARLERRLAALRCVEAFRLYAAAHDGKLPGALSDITEVPIPDDPMTGKSFEYRAPRRQGDLARTDSRRRTGHAAKHADLRSDHAEQLTFIITQRGPIMKHFFMTALILAWGLPALADEPTATDVRASTIAPFLDTQTMVVGHADLSRLDVDSIVKTLGVLAAPEAEQQKEMRQGLSKWLAAFRKAGGKDIYVLLSLEDMPESVPLLMVPLADGADTAALDQLLPDNLFPATRDPRENLKPVKWHTDSFVPGHQGDPAAVEGAEAGLAA